jgi:hypothetical protein
MSQLEGKQRYGDSAAGCGESNRLEDLRVAPDVLGANRKAAATLRLSQFRTEIRARRD